MKRSIAGIAGTILLAGAFLTPAAAQQKYTNADLEMYRLQGAYTNEDLVGLESLPDQNAALYAYPEVDLDRWLAEQEWAYEQRLVRYWALAYELEDLQAELDYQNENLDIAYSARGGNTNQFLYGGLRSQVQPRRAYLERRIALLERQITAFHW